MSSHGALTWGEVLPEPDLQRCCYLCSLVRVDPLQAMTVPNREYVARQVDALETVLRVAQRAKTDSKLLKPITGILGCLFKESEEVLNMEHTLG